MTQTGRPRTSRDARDRRHGLVAVVMLLLALGAGVLVSAGSAHHQPGADATASAGVTVTDDGALTSPLSAHEHRRGNDWAPTLSKRLRPAVTVALLSVLPPPLTETGVRGNEPTSPVPPPTDDVLAMLGVLRV